MKKLTLGAVALLCVGTTALAQTPTIKLTAEDTHTIKEIVLKESSFPRNAAADYKVGDAVPSSVDLQTFPGLIANKVSAARSHRFFISGNKVVVVDPKDNTVAEVIE